MLDGDDAAEWVEDGASELVRWVDRREARAPGDRGQRNRAHEDSCRRHQGSQSVERDTGHDTDDRLLRAKGQIRESASMQVPSGVDRERLTGWRQCGRHALPDSRLSRIATLPAFRLRWQPGGLTRTLRVGKGLDPDDPPITDGQER